MVRTLALFATWLVIGLCCGRTTEAGAPDRYDITWNSPSADASGSMPLGNGDIGLNAWPKDWNVTFQLHALRQTVISEYRDGRIIDLKVTPADRRDDIVLPPGEVLAPMHEEFHKK